MMPRRISRVPPRSVARPAHADALLGQRRSSGSGSARRRRERADAPLGHVACSNVVAEVLDEGRLEVGHLAGLQHAGDRQRHLPQRPQPRGQPAERIGRARSGFVAGAPDELDDSSDTWTGTAPGRCARRPARRSPAPSHRPPRPPACRSGTNDVVEDHLVEIVLAGEIADRPDRDAAAASGRRATGDSPACRVFRSAPARCAPGRSRSALRCAFAGPDLACR